MITLTTPEDIKSVLGSNATVGYNKLVIGPFTFDPVTLGITAQMRLTVASDPDSQPITGSLTINTVAARLEFRMDQIDVLRKIVLTGPQNTAAQTIVRNAQNALEAGLITLAVVAGVQTPGA